MIIRTNIYSTAKTLLRYIIWIISFLLSYLIPKKKWLYLFWWINSLQFSWNSKALFLWYRKNHPEVTCHYMTRNPELIQEHVHYNLLHIHTFYSYRLFLRAEYLFVDTDVFDVSSSVSYQIWNFSIICLRHGEPLKKIGADTKKQTQLDNKSSLFRYLFKQYHNKNIKIWTTSSSATQQTMNSAFLTDRFTITWLPRNDVFFDTSLHTDTTSSKINKEEFKKHILYAPTWRDIPNWRIWFSDEELMEINTYCSKHNYQFILSLHHYTQTQYDMNIDRSHILFCHWLKLDTQELLYHVDVLITDYSSIYIDFLLTKKPVLFYAYDLESYMSTRWLYYAYEEATIPESTSHTFKEFMWQLTHIHELSRTSQYQTSYTSILDLFHTYQQWWACNRLHQKIQKLS